MMRIPSCLQNTSAALSSGWFCATNSLTVELQQACRSGVIFALPPSVNLEQKQPTRMHIHQLSTHLQQRSIQTSAPSFFTQSRSSGLNQSVPQQSFALHQHTRSMAIVVDVVDSNVEQALKMLQRKAKDAGIQAELRKRSYFMNGEQQRHKHEQGLWNRAMGRKVEERIKWVTKRRLVKM